jgi:hypothetical protein
MTTANIQCSECRSDLPPNFFNSGRFDFCPRCGAAVRVEVFPALFREVKAEQPQTVIIEGESSCFYHATKKAVIPCDSCGRFLCALCDIDLNGQHICPVCLETGKKKGKLQTLTNRCIRYDNIAMTVAVISLLACLFPSIVGGPVALFISLYYRNKMSSGVHQSKVWFTVATIIASLEILGWIGFFVFHRST